MPSLAWRRGLDAAGGLRVLGLGVALLAAALVFDAEPLYVPGIAFVVLALLAGLWVALAGIGSRVERRVGARRVMEGEPLHAHLAVRGGPIGLAGAVLDDSLLDAPRPLPIGARTQRLRVDARFARRGRRDLAPPALVVGDPLGLVSLRRTATQPAASVLVLPRVEPVRAARRGDGDGSGAGRRRSIAGAAEVEFDGLRAWQPGTPASRIHWPALARGAGLVERRLLPEADARPLVVLDPRHAADEAALDAAVRATASLTVYLARRGGCALLLPGDRRPAPLDGELHGWTALHVRLALLEGVGTPALTALSGRRGPILLVVAHVPERPPRALVASPSAQRMLVVPGQLAGRRASFEVGGCTGYEPQPGERGGARRMTERPPLTARDLVRLVALAALLLVGLVRWLALVRESHMGDGVAFALAASIVGVGLVAATRLGSAGGRLAAGVTATVALAAAALHAAGVPLALLDPRDWDVIAAGLADGIGALPGVTVPYRGVDEWVRVTIQLGGLLLVAVAVLSATWPRAGGRVGARGWALVAIAVLYAVPGIQLTADHPWLVGALFAIPLLVFVLAERLPLRLGAAAAGGVLAVVLAAMAIAPAIDGDEPVVDVQELASALQPEQPDRFSWSHGYGPLDWPRDGRELLRVRSRRPSYWKAQDLELFDGVRWTSQMEPSRLTPIAEGLDEHPGWRQEVRVTVEEMSTRQFIAPGETLSISRAPRQPVNTRPGGFSVAEGEDDLTDGSAYLAEAYVPRPSAELLRSTEVDYPIYLGDQLTMLTPGGGSTPSAMIRFMPFGTGAAPIASGPGVGSWQGVELLGRSGYGEVYALAQELAAGAPTPYDFARRIEQHLSGPEFFYDEAAAERRLPVPAFLLRDKAGYCQHFSAAMALLLRMGGVPARVAGGFTAGQLDRERREYVVRDLDAHSWVEVWFDDVGWVSFDPTPSEAPARSQAVDSGLAEPGVVPGGPQPSGAIGDGADLGAEGVPAPLEDPAAEQSTGWGAVAALLGVAVAAIAGWALWRRRDQMRRRSGGGDEPELIELERALRRTGRPLAPGTTLLQLEQRFAQSPGVRAYLRAVATRRYADGGDGPSAAQRRALRRDLARGLGPVGRVRAWWAVPPRPRLH